MPHQCLKCGTLFPDGTTQILRGCPDCRGTRFFFTDEAIPEEERTKLLRDGEADLSAVLRDLSERSRGPPGETAQEAPSPLGPPAGDERPPVPPAATAKVLPGNKLLIRMRRRRLARRVRQVTATRGWDYDSSDALEHELDNDPVPLPEVEPATRPPAPPTKPPAPATRAPEPSTSAAPDGDRVDARAPWPGQAPPPEPREPRVERVSYSEDSERSAGGDPPAATVRVEIERRRVGGDAEDVPDSDGAPETVRIDAPGLYNIDVKRLLEEAPIVIQKDGSYLIHLPSLFESDSGRKTRQDR